MIKRYIKNSVMYEFCVDYDNSGIPIQHLRINTSGKTVIIPVKSSNEFSIKINKKSIAANKGILGLFTFIVECINQDFMICYVNKIIDTFVNMEG